MTQKKIVNHIAVVLDRSGSMNKIREETISGFNEQLKTFRDNGDGQDNRVTLVTFGTTPDEPRFFPVDEELTEEDYTPRGWTSLYDAIGDTVTMLQAVEEEQDADTAFLVIIITDGQENHSKRFNRHQVAGMIKELEEAGNWTFTYLGANHNVFATTASLNIAEGNSKVFQSVSDGVTVSNHELSASNVKYLKHRGTGGQSMRNFHG